MAVTFSKIKSLFKNMTTTKHLLKTQLIAVALFIGSNFLVSCQGSSSDKPIYMGFDDVEFVTEFPQIFTLEEKVIPEIDVIGIRNFLIYDSIMVIGTSNPDAIWSFFSLPDYRPLGSFLTRGEGPLEFMQGPTTSGNSKIMREKGQLVAYLYDFQKGNLKKFEISQSLASGELHLDPLEVKLPAFLPNFIMMDSSTFFTKEIGNRDTQQLRYVYEAGEKKSLPILDKLNQAAIMEGEDFNILATNTKYNDIRKRFVEAPTDLNYVNIYSLDSAIAKTICIGDKLADISMIQKEWPKWNRKYVFVNIQAFNDFFGVIYVNESNKSYQTKRKQLPTIMLFDWEGTPLAELKMDNHFTHFDIDFLNHELYTFDVHSDEFFKFDVRDILSKLKSNT